MYEPAKYPNRACNDFSRLIFRQIQCSIEYTKMVELDQVAFEHEDRAVNSLKV